MLFLFPLLSFSSSGSSERNIREERIKQMGMKGRTRKEKGRVGKNENEDVWTVRAYKI